MRISAGKSIPGKGNRNLKGLDARTFLAWARNNKEVNVTRAE